MIFLFCFFYYFFRAKTYSHLRRARAWRALVSHPTLVSARTAPSDACTSTLELSTNTNTNNAVLASEDPGHTYLLTTQSTDLEVLSPTYDYKFRSALAFALILG